MPYRVDISNPPHDALDRLLELGALDIEQVGAGLAVILPDSLSPDALVRSLAGAGLTISDAPARDNGSVWLLSPRPVRIGNVVIAPPEADVPPGALLLHDSTAFGTGHHPTTALCIEAIEEIVSLEMPNSILDVGTGSGILALAALKMGVPRAAGLDLDANALQAAAENARLNQLSDRLRLVLGGPAAVEGNWPLVVANVLAAPLIELAPVLVRRVAGRGRLILSGIPSSLESEVRQAYQHLGMRSVGSQTRAGWTAVIVQASW